MDTLTRLFYGATVTLKKGMTDSFKLVESGDETGAPKPEEGGLVPRVLGFDVGDRRIGWLFRISLGM